MNTQSGINPIAPSRKNRKTKSNTSKYELLCLENGLRNSTDIGDMGLVGSLQTAAMTETIQDSCDADNCVAENDQGSSTTLSNLNINTQQRNKDEKSGKGNDGPENDALTKKTTGMIDKGGVSKSDFLESLTESRNVDATKEGSTCPRNVDATKEGSTCPRNVDATKKGSTCPRNVDATKKGSTCPRNVDAIKKGSRPTCPSSVNVETVGDLSNTQTLPPNTSPAKEEENRDESCGEADDTGDYPENLNPFENSALDPDDGSETLIVPGCGDNCYVELGPVRQTAKTRPSLYPWRPFAGETAQYKSHMLPARQTIKKRASLYPWNPFGEQDYPEELNPFNEIVQDDNYNGHDHKQLTNTVKEDSKSPGIEESLGLNAPSQGIPEEKLTQDIREEQRDSNTEDDDVEKPKQTGRGKRVFKTIRKKFRIFWNRVFRR